MEDRRLVWTVRIIGFLLFSIALLFFPSIFTLFGYIGTLLGGGYLGLTVIIVLLFTMFRLIGEVLFYSPGFFPLLDFLLTPAESRGAPQAFFASRKAYFLSHLLDKRIKVWGLRVLGLVCFAAGIAISPVFAAIANGFGEDQLYILYIIFLIYFITLSAPLDLLCYAPAFEGENLSRRKFPKFIRIFGWSIFILVFAVIIGAFFIVK